MDCSDLGEIFPDHIFQGSAIMEDLQFPIPGEGGLEDLAIQKADDQQKGAFFGSTGLSPSLITSCANTVPLPEDSSFEEDLTTAFSLNDLLSLKEEKPLLTPPYSCSPDLWESGVSTDTSNTVLLDQQVSCSQPVLKKESKCNVK